MADDGVRIEHPNREKASSKVTRMIVFALLIATVVLMTIITWGGWGTIEGAKPLQVGYILLYIVLAVMVLRWSRGVLPLAAALAMILLIFAAVSAPEWFDRDKAGFTDPTLDEGILGLLTALLVPLQILLIAFAMSGFRQAWNVEIERHREGGDRPSENGRGRGEPASTSAAPA
jgi:hypothetical protein